jgi:hypothetical protein
VYAACNITESLRLKKYQYNSCGIVNDKSRYYLQIHIYSILTPITTCFVAARMLARLKLDVGLGPDDYVILAAFFAYLIDVAAGLGIVLHGFGMHTWYLTPYQVSKSLEVRNTPYSSSCVY